MKLENLTFRGGIHIEDFKELSNGSEITAMPAPEKVKITLSQHSGAPAKAIVEKGDQVKLGQVIAEPGGFVSAPVHATVSGEVLGIEKYLTSAGTEVDAIVIQNDGLDTIGYPEVDRSNEKLDKEQILEYIAEAGIVGMGGAGFPTRVKLIPPSDADVDTVIINAAECEPYLTSDDAMMKAYPEKIVEGLKLAMKTVDAEKGYIAIEDNKPRAIEAIENAVGDDSNIAVAVLKTKYPQGDEKQLIYAVTGRKMPAGTLPAHSGCVVTNTSTAAAIVDAVYYGKPLIERVVTVTGQGVNNPQNLVVRFGTRIKDIVEFSGGYSGTPGKIIFGGPMMGVAQYTDEAVTDKRNNGILVLTQEQVKPKPVDPCIRCGKCVEHCPHGLEPNFLASASKAENWEVAEEFYVTQCVECGVCSYICPSHRPLTEYIRYGKRTVMGLQKAAAAKAKEEADKKTNEKANKK